MKPMQVEAGQHAPDVDELVEKAGSMMEKLQMDNSQIRNITGVEEAPMNHYHTNQYIEDSAEDVTNKGATSENVKFIDANPHQSGSTLDAHENPSGGDPHPPSSYTHSSVGKPPSDIKKEVEIILKKRCSGCGKKCDAICKNVSCSLSKAPPPGKPDIAALLGGAGGGGGDMPPPPGGDEGGMGDMPPDGMPPGEGELPPAEGDEPESKEDLTMKIHELVDKLAGGDEGEMGDMPPPPGGPPGGLPPGGPPGGDEGMPPGPPPPGM